MKTTIITTKLHGFLDHFTSMALMTIPRMLGWSNRVQRLHDTMALTTASYSAMTNYELGLFKKIPMKGHLALDAAAGSILLACAATMDDAECSERRGMAIEGAWFLLAAACTKRVSKSEKKQRRERMLREHPEQLPIERYGQQHRPEAADVS